MVGRFALPEMALSSLCTSNQIGVYLICSLLNYRKTPLLIPGVDHFSNENYIELNIYASNFKNRFNRELDDGFMINSS